MPITPDQRMALSLPLSAVTSASRSVSPCCHGWAQTAVASLVTISEICYFCICGLEGASSSGWLRNWCSVESRLTSFQPWWDHLKGEGQLLRPKETSDNQSPPGLVGKEVLLILRQKAVLAKGRVRIQDSMFGKPGWRHPKRGEQKRFQKQNLK